MNKIIITLIVVITTITSLAQAQVKNDVGTLSDNSQNKQNYEPPVIYQLFPTKNMWTFIKLNSRNGQMWQVQYDIEGSNRFETYLNLLFLVDKEKEVNGRFTLYPTQNTWTFILLDQHDGKMWQVQWSFEPENRGIIPID